MREEVTRYRCDLDKLQKDYAAYHNPHFNIDVKISREEYDNAGGPNYLVVHVISEPEREEF